MYRNSIYALHLRWALKGIRRNWLNSLIITISLTLGITSINFITGFVMHELTANKWHHNPETIFRLLGDNPFENAKLTSSIIPNAPEQIVSTYPEVTDYCQVLDIGLKKLSANGVSYNNRFNASYASASFFNFFGYRIKQSNGNPPLTQPNGAFIKEQLATLLFENEDNAIGKFVTIETLSDTLEYEVMGVVEDSPLKSHIQFDILISNHVLTKYGTRVYLRLDDPRNSKQLEEKFEADRGTLPIIYSDKPGAYHLQPLADVYFDTSTQWYKGETRREKSYIYVFLAIGIALLLVAGFNFVSLLSANIKQRIKSISVQQILGANPNQAAQVFVAEIAILVTSALLLSLLLTAITLAPLSQLLQTNLSLEFFLSPKMILLSLGIVVAVALAFYVLIIVTTQRNSPLDNITQRHFSTSKKSYAKLLTTTQLMISAVLAITVTIIGKQISYINSKNLGLDKDIHSINISGVNPSTALTLKQELTKLPSVKSAAVASSVPFFGYWTTLGYYGPSDAEKKYELALIVGDLDLPTVLGISVEQGSAFTHEHSNQPVCLVNQTLAKQFGWENAIGETLPSNSERIVGVVRNFHCNSLIEPIIPAAILINPNGDKLLVKFANSLTDTEYQQVLAIWQRLTGKKDLEILSMSSKLQEINGEHSRMLSLLQILCALAFFITGIGIFANTKSQMQNRLKEITIRKINGASIANIFGMLYKDFALRSIAAFAIAIPIANYLATRWLSQFAYQTNLSWWFYTIGIVLSAVVIVFTITAGALNAGKANPVEVLKTE